MNDKLAKTISFIFHPIAIPTYTIILFYFQKSFISSRLNLEIKLWLLGIIILTTIIIPSFFIYFFLLKGIIRSGYMQARHERNIPYIITAIFFYVAYYMVRQLPLSLIYERFLLGATSIVVISFIINFWWKISIHMTAIGGMLGAFIGITNLYFINTLYIQIAIILCSGIIGSARLQLKAHHPSQIYSGFFMGLLVMMGIFYSLR